MTAHRAERVLDVEYVGSEIRCSCGLSIHALDLAPAVNEYVEHCLSARHKDELALKDADARIPRL